MRLILSTVAVLAIFASAAHAGPLVDDSIHNTATGGAGGDAIAGAISGSNSSATALSGSVAGATAVNTTTNRLSNENDLSNRNSNVGVNEQGQLQGQGQGQTQSSSSASAVTGSGNSSNTLSTGASTAASSSDNANNASQAVNVDASNHYQRPVATASAPIVVNVASCAIGGSGAVQGATFGVSLGGAKIDRACNTRANALLLMQLGENEAGVLLLSTSDPAISAAVTEARTRAAK